MYVLFFYVTIFGPNPNSASVIKPLIKAGVFQPTRANNDDPEPSTDPAQTVPKPPPKKTTKTQRTEHVCRKSMAAQEILGAGGGVCCNEWKNDAKKWALTRKITGDWMDVYRRSVLGGRHQSFCTADLRGFNELALPKHSLWAACWLSNKLHFTENKSGSLKPQGL